MQQDATALDSRHVPPEGEKCRLLVWEHLDQRTTAALKVRRFEQGIGSDLGGFDHLTEAQKALARRAAVLAAVIEDQEARWAKGAPLDLSAYKGAVAELRRTLVTLGLERRARVVSGLERFTGGG